VPQDLHHRECLPGSPKPRLGSFLNVSIRHRATSWMVFRGAPRIMRFLAICMGGQFGDGGY
jgi:hypothetical protein